jgi:hypothetical protein
MPLFLCFPQLFEVTNTGEGYNHISIFAHLIGV